MKIQDFNCTYDNAVGINSEITKKLNLTFPDAYLHWDTMAEVAKAIQEHEGADFCELPFCHTVEAEAMGGKVNYGNEIAGPRAGEYVCTSVEEILELPEINFEEGRIHQVLLACRELREQGKHVVLDVSGPFTVLNVLIDPKYVFKAMRKTPEIMQKVFDKIGAELLKYIEIAQEYGVDMISYADSSGGLNILGPKMAEQTVDAFTYDFLKKVSRILKPETLILLCPKTTLALLGTEKAEFSEEELTGPVSYGKGCIEMIGKAQFVGQMCIKNIGYKLEFGKIKTVKLK